MVHQHFSELLLLFASSLGFFVLAFAHLSNVSSSHGSLPLGFLKEKIRSFKIDNDIFWKDDEPIQLIGGDLHYFRVLPKYWEDRLLRAKALGLNTIQTYVPWNLHEPLSENWVFEGIADIESFLKLTQELDFLVMLRAGPYICAEWDLGGFPAWLLAIEPALKLRSSDPVYLNLVERWWGILLPKIVPFLYVNGGPIVMVQIENEYGSFGDDKAYLRHLATLARIHLGNDTILYTTDGGTKDTLDKGAIPEEGVYAAVDFSTDVDPLPIFELQKRYNAPGKSPRLSSEFYTGWLTHWGEPIANTDANFTAASLEKILSLNASAVLYMAHGGTNFGFFNGANTGHNDSDYKPDLTSYDYDAPIKESGDVDTSKYRELRNVIAKYSRSPLPPVPSGNGRAEYRMVKVNKIGSLFDALDLMCLPTEVVETKEPIPMELVGQMFGFLLYESEFSEKESQCTLSIPKVHDRAQVFVSCPSEDDQGSPVYVGTIQRGSNRELEIPNIKCSLKIRLFILVENMGRVNYGSYIYDRKGILSSVAIDGNNIHGWKLYPILLEKFSPSKEKIRLLAGFNADKIASRKHLSNHSQNVSEEPRFYEAHYFIDPNDQIKDVFISFQGWNKGVAFVNNFNIGRFWPSMGPQCTLYVPAPILRHGENVVVIFELHAPNPELTIEFVQQPNFTCGQIKRFIY